MEIRQTETSFNWSKELSKAYRNLEDLLRYLNLNRALAPFPLDFNSQFPLLVTPHYAAKIEKQNWRDPLLMQILPLVEENHFSPFSSLDPLGEVDASLKPGLLHKYSSRVLLLPTGQCAIHCRYCFRRNFDYPTSSLSRLLFQEQLETIKTLPEVNEVILSGGDPLTLSNSHLERIINTLATLKQIKSIRIHTRIPSVLPERIDGPFLNIVKNSGVNIIMVLHINHPREIEPENKNVFLKLKDSCLHLLNQTVLLKNINNNINDLEKLSLKLIDCGVKPYYLHQLDPVKGTHHFSVPETEGLSLLEGLRRRLPGYAVPNYVQEHKGEAYKKPLLN